MVSLEKLEQLFGMMPQSRHAILPLSVDKMFSSELSPISMVDAYIYYKAYGINFPEGTLVPHIGMYIAEQFVRFHSL